MRNRLKIIIPLAAALLIITGVLVFVLTRHHPAKPQTKTVVKNCSLLSESNAVKYLGKGTYLQQQKTSKVGSTIVVGCQYNKPHSAEAIIIGQKTATTNYGEQTLQRSFFSNVASGEAEIKFAGYLGFGYPKKPGNIRIWFKNTWVQVFSPSQKISAEVLTSFIAER